MTGQIQSLNNLNVTYQRGVELKHILILVHLRSQLAKADTRFHVHTFAILFENRSIPSPGNVYS